MLINPITLYAEARHLAAVGVINPLSMLTAEEGALVTTPFHMASNRLREMARGGARHGSCGMGVGETTRFSLDHPDEALRVQDLRSPIGGRLKHRLRFVQAVFRAELAPILDRLPGRTDAIEREWSILTDDAAVDHAIGYYERFAADVRIVDPEYLGTQLRKTNAVFEGAQGVLLDQKYGFQPHTTWTNVTFANALNLLKDYQGDITRVGVLRAYATRHGSGPFVTENPVFTPLAANDHNTYGDWQLGFRSGALDLVTARYASDVLGGVDELAVTCLDRLPLLGRVPVCVGYEAQYPIEGHPGFEATGCHVRRINANSDTDYAQQENLTKAFERMTPVYEHVLVRDPDEALIYARGIVARLPGTHLGSVAFGPTYEDRRAV
jgi:adenylosuccinate synthase